jgi:hypothetical protein
MNFIVEDIQAFISERDCSPVTKPRGIFENVPQWFINAMRRLKPDAHAWDAGLPGGDGEAAVMVFQQLNFWDSSWFDHVGWVGDSLVAEPYRLTSEGISALTDFCQQSNTKFDITGASFHYPTRTLRIAIRPN